MVDLHALTVPYDPTELTESTRRLATWLMAAGLDPDRSLLFVQSHVRAHAELTWVLNCSADVRRAAPHDAVQGEVARARSS